MPSMTPRAQGWSHEYASAMGLLDAWRSSRLRRRFMSEDAVLDEELAEGRAPDATVDEVGVPGVDHGFSGDPIRSRVDTGHGSGDPNSPGWAGWGA